MLPSHCALLVCQPSHLTHPCYFEIQFSEYPVYVEAVEQRCVRSPMVSYDINYQVDNQTSAFWFTVNAN